MEPEQRHTLDRLNGARYRVPEREPEPDLDSMLDPVPEPVAIVDPEPENKLEPSLQEAAAHLANQEQKEEKQDGTRWLYDSDDDFDHAQKKLQKELAREKLKKDMAQKARVHKAQELKFHVTSKLRTHTPKVTAFARRNFSKFIKNKKAVIAASGIAAVLILTFAFVPRPGSDKNPAAPVLGTSDQQAPAYDTLFPNNDIQAASSKQFAYEPQKKVTSFTDEIGDATVTVSQQPLPERFKKDPSGELANFAKDFNATEKLDLIEMTVYIGTSIKGPQTAVFIRNNLLVFIAADKKFDKQFLSDYIIALQ